ncbi:MAG: hypothetical protein RLN70_04545, partial [Rhodospirillaceae bacterium]
LAHHNVRTRMSVDNLIEAMNILTPAAPDEALPVVTFEDGVKLHINGDTLNVVHTAPAHTDGDSVIKWEKANVLHAGDIFNRSGAPFVDRGSGGTVSGLIVAMDTMIGMTDENTKVIPGHGPVGTRADMISYREAVKNVLERVRTEHAAGKSLEEILALKLEWPVTPFAVVPADRLVQAAYEEVTGE